jgi:hypothetical protein
MTLRSELTFYSSQGAHVTQTMYSDGTYNTFADSKMHLSVTYMEKPGFLSEIPFGQDIHIYVDEKTDALLPYTDNNPNFSWGNNPNKQLRAANRTVISHFRTKNEVILDALKRDKTPSPEPEPRRDPAAGLGPAPYTTPAWGAPKLVLDGTDEDGIHVRTFDNTVKIGQTGSDPDKWYHYTPVGKITPIEDKGKEAVKPKAESPAAGARSNQTQTTSTASSSNQRDGYSYKETADGRKFRRTTDPKRKIKYERFSGSQNKWVSSTEKDYNAAKRK